MGTLAKIRRLYFRDKQSIKEICRQTGMSRNTVRSWLRDPEMVEPKKPAFSRSGAAISAVICSKPLLKVLREGGVKVLRRGIQVATRGGSKFGFRQLMSEFSRIARNHVIGCMPRAAGRCSCRMRCTAAGARPQVLRPHPRPSARSPGEWRMHCRHPGPAGGLAKLGAPIAGKTQSRCANCRKCKARMPVFGLCQR